LNRPKLLYKLFELEVHDQHLTEVLGSLAQSIREVSSELDQIAENNNHECEVSSELNQIAENCDYEWLDIRSEDAAIWLENVLGVCFVICQVYIDRVGKQLEQVCQRACKANIDLGSIPRTKEAAIDCGDLLRTCENITKVRSIHCLANYFKHQAEWNYEWEGLSNQQTRTANVIQKLGCHSHSDGNFRNASEFFTNTEYYRTDVFEKIVRTWAETLLDALKTQLHIEDHV
jgi:hypothetical protein